MGERTYRIQVVGQRTGLTEGLIRAWERRYGVPRPRRSGGGYRVYTEADIEVLRRLRQLTQEGVSIGEAVKLVPELRREAKAQVSGAPAQAVAGDGAQLERWAAEIEAAAQRFDQRKVEAVLDEALASAPPLAVTSQLLLPVLRRIGEGWREGRISIVSEHLVGQSIRARLLALIEAAPRGARGHAICACFPDEEHEAGLLSAALRLRHAGYRVTYLGPRTPAAELGRMVRELSADLVGLSAVNPAGPEEFESRLARITQALPPGTRVWIGGAGAAQHPKICADLGARLLLDEDAWARALA